ncbi:MAG: glycosyltransferase [Cytophagales bacterium]|nr:glycosyltransferase [Cytophagales bacterium]
MSSLSKKVLIVTYYWPPSGGSGVQRWLKFVKYLPQFGWEPFVFTPENPSVEIRDESLLKDVPAEAEVIRFPIWEPYTLFRKVSTLAGQGSVKQMDMVTTGKRSLFQKMSAWMRGNLLIPDARVFWVKPSVTFLADFLKSNGITTVVTTGPPHSLHLIGLRLKKLDPSIRWIADMRDPWSEWDFLDTLALAPWARRRHQTLERKVLTNADRIITIAPYHVARFEKLAGRKVDLITNGFDEEDFAGVQHKPTVQFTVRHIGMVDTLRDPRPFMEVVRTLLAREPGLKEKIRIEFIGSVNTAFRKFISSDPALAAVTSFVDPLPHDLLVKLYETTDMQLLVLAHTVLAPGNLPGKFFEYLASGNFIFGMGPEDGDAARILQQTNAGRMIDRSDGLGMERLLTERMAAWANGSVESGREVRAFSRRSLTTKLAEVLSELSR